MRAMDRLYGFVWNGRADLGPTQTELYFHQSGIL